MFIYAITNDVNDKVYVGLHAGKDLRTRWTTHRSFAKRGSNSIISLAMRKYGIEKFHITSIWSGHVSLESLKVLERYYISSLNSRVPNGYNLTAGGEGTSGFKHSDEERIRRSDKMRAQIASGNIPSLLGTKRDPTIGRKISLTRTGKKNRNSFSEQTKQKITKALLGNKYSLGHKWTPEATAKRLASRAGYHHSEETKRKIGAANAIKRKGQKQSAEHVAKRTAKLIGRKHSEESKRKMSEARRKRVAVQN